MLLSVDERSQALDRTQAGLPIKAGVLRDDDS
jgi:hypothetical protein